MSLQSSRLEVVCKTGVFKQFVQNSQKSTCARVVFEYFWRLESCNFIIKEVRHGCCPVSFSKFFIVVIHHLCATASGISTILVIVIKTLKRCFLYYVYVAGMAIELKLGSPELITEKQVSTQNLLWYHGYRIAFGSSNYSKKWACNNIILTLFVRSFVAVYIQRRCSIIIRHVFLVAGLTISIMLEVVHPGFMWTLTVCFLYGLVFLRIFTIGLPRNRTFWSNLSYDFLEGFDWKVN